MNSDPNTLERYCSSYYDKQGLYNDGFPCPADKYCCQNADGMKMCCSLNEHKSSTSVAVELLKTTSSNILSSISNNHHVKTFIDMNINNNINNNHNNNNNKANLFNKPSSSISISDTQISSTLYASSSLPLFLSNSSLIISVCIGLIALASIIIILLLCLCRCYLKNSSTRHQSITKSSTNQQLKHTKSMSHGTKKSSYNRNSSCTSSSVTSSSTNGSSSASTTSSSPKTNEITIFCENDDDVHQKILMIDPSCHQRQLADNCSNSTSFMLNNPLSSTGNQSEFVQHRNLNIYSHGSTYINAMSSGSGSICASHTPLLQSNLNSTQSSFMTHTTNNNNNNNANPHQMMSLEDADDFLMSTSSNLEFLKTHSLFNTTPLNYYPSMTLTSSLKAPTTIIEDPPTYSDSQSLFKKPLNSFLHGSTNEQTLLNPPTIITQQQQQQQNMLDYRFSTFLPPVFHKNNEFM